MRRSLWGQQTGSALVLVMILGLATTIVGIALGTTTQTNMKYAQRSEDQIQAQLYARSGVELAVALIMEKTEEGEQAFFNEVRTFYGSLGTEFSLVPPVASDHNISFTINKDNDEYSIDSIGYVRRGTLEVSGSSSFLIAVKDLEGELDTGVGALYALYGDSRLEMKNTSRVNGDVVINPEGATEVSTSYPPSIQKEKFSAELPAVPTLENRGKLERSGATTTIATDGRYSAIELKGTAELVLDTSQKTLSLVVDSLEIKGDARIRVIGNGVLLLFVTTKLEVTNQGSILKEDSAGVAIISHGNTSIEFKSGAIVHAAVYAPEAKYEMADTATLYGSAFVHRAELKDSAVINYRPFREQGLSFAVFADEWIQLSSTPKVKGNVATNAKDEGKVSFSPNGTGITGQLFVGAGALDVVKVVSHPSYTTLQDHISTLPMQTLPKEIQWPLPTFPEFPVLPFRGELDIQWNTPEADKRIAVDGFYGKIVVSSGRDLTFVAHNEDRVIVIRELVVSGGSRIHIDQQGTGRVLLHIEQTLNVTGGSKINENGSPDNLRIFHKGTADLSIGGNEIINGSLFVNTASISLPGSNRLAGDIIALTEGTIKVTGASDSLARVLYAPKADFQLLGSATFSGIAVVKSLFIQGGSGYRFDGTSSVSTSFFESLQWGQAGPPALKLSQSLVGEGVVVTRQAKPGEGGVAVHWSRLGKWSEK